MSKAVKLLEGQVMDLAAEVDGLRKTSAEADHKARVRVAICFLDAAADLIDAASREGPIGENAIAGAAHALVKRIQELNVQLVRARASGVSASAEPK